MQHGKCLVWIAGDGDLTDGAKIADVDVTFIGRQCGEVGQIRVSNRRCDGSGDRGGRWRRRDAERDSPSQQLVDLVDRVLTGALEHGPKVGMEVDGVQPSGANEAVDQHRAAPARSEPAKRQFLYPSATAHSAHSVGLSSISTRL